MKYQLLPSLSTEDLAALRADISTHGVQVPVIVDENGDIIDGHHRAAIAKELGLTFPSVVQEGLSEASKKLMAVSVNVNRRHLNGSQKAALAIEMLPLLEAQAKERQGARTDLAGDLPQTFAESGEAREQAAQLVGTNRQYVSDAKAIVKTAPELLGHMKAGTLTLPEAKMMAKASEATRAEVIERLASGTAKNAREAARQVNRAKKREVLLLEAVQGKFAVILADPPWRYDNNGVHSAVEDQYPTMETEAIAALPVADLTTENAVLFMWATNPLLEDALAVMKAWGFEYRTNFVWTKDRQMNIGFYALGKHELLLVGVKGSMLPERSTLRASVIEAPRQEHSRKPDVVHGLIEQMYPGMPYLEMFARSQRPGWTVFGNETDKFTETASTAAVSAQEDTQD